MPIINKKYTIILFLGLLVIGSVGLLPLDIPYTTRTKALVKPAYEWELLRDETGTLSSVFRNHENGLIESYGNTEFKRGDVINFFLKPGLKEGDLINKGDTIGFTYSNEERMRLIELEGQLSVLESELSYYTAGQKPEDIEWAQREVELANSVFETQQKLMARTEQLMKDSVISVQKFEIDQNELEVTRMRKVLAEARLTSLLAGDKPEQIALTRSKILATNLQIAQIKERLSYLTVTAPISGQLSSGKGYIQKDILLRIIDPDKFIGTAPIKLSDRSFISLGDEVYLIKPGASKKVIGRVIEFNNNIELMIGEPVVYMTIAFDEVNDLILPGNLVEIEIKGASLNPREYFVTSFQKPR